MNINKSINYKLTREKFWDNNRQNRMFRSKDDENISWMKDQIDVILDTFPNCILWTSYKNSKLPSQLNRISKVGFEPLTYQS